MDKFYAWFDDKTQVIFVILVFGIVAMAMRVDGSLALMEKMAYGLLGMAVGKGVNVK